MSNSVTQLKPPSAVEPLADLSARPAVTGQALDSLVDQILARASKGPAPEDASQSGGMSGLNARLPPAAVAAREAANAAAQTLPPATQAPPPAAQTLPPAIPTPPPTAQTLPPATQAPPPAAAVPPAQAVAAASLIDEDAAWLPSDPERREVFLQVFRFWHSQVQPQYAAQATPAFLYLVTTLPVLIKARDALKVEALWEPKTQASVARRDAHPAWKKYCEFLPRAQRATIEIETYSSVSLERALDDLFVRVTSAEKMFRQA